SPQRTILPRRNARAPGGERTGDAREEQERGNRNTLRPFTRSLRAKSTNRDAVLHVTPRRPSTPLRFARDDSSERSAKVLEAVQALFDHVKACRVTEPDGTIVTESSTRYDGDVGFAQQTVSEILRRESKLADVYQDIKRALGFDRGDIGNLRDAVKHVVATHI